MSGLECPLNMAHDSALQPVHLHAQTLQKLFLAMSQLHQLSLMLPDQCRPILRGFHHLSGAAAPATCPHLPTQAIFLPHREHTQQSKSASSLTWCSTCRDPTAESLPRQEESQIVLGWQIPPRTSCLSSPRPTLTHPPFCPSFSAWEKPEEIPWFSSPWQAFVVQKPWCQIPLPQTQGWPPHHRGHCRKWREKVQGHLPSRAPSQEHCRKGMPTSAQHWCLGCHAEAAGDKEVGGRPGSCAFLAGHSWG